MRKVLFILLSGLLFVPGYAQSTEWTIDPAHSKIGFTVVHMVISEVSGSFTDFSGTVHTDKVDFSDAQVNLTIKAASINTLNDKRDEHLRSPDFFDVTRYPEIIFKSTSMKKVGDHTYKLTGDLTMHGVTKKVVLDATLGGVIQDPYGKSRAGFKVSGTLNRSDYGLTWNHALESGGVVVSDEVELLCNVEMVKGT